MAALPSPVPARVLIAATSPFLMISAQAEADVTLALSQPAYEVGEPVRFTLTNDTKCVITLPHAVGGCYIVPVELSLFPGQSLTAHWDQHLCSDGPQVPKGRYYLLGAWESYDGCPRGYQELPVDIGMMPVEPTSWGGIKSLLREH